MRVKSFAISRTKIPNRKYAPPMFYLVKSSAVSNQLNFNKSNFKGCQSQRVEIDTNIFPKQTLAGERNTPLSAR